MALTNLTKGLTVDSEGGSATTNLVQGLAKAWCNYTTASTFVNNDSFNVGSLTDRATGQYEVNFTTNMGNANHCPTANTNGSSGTNSFASLTFVATGTSHSSMTGNSTSTTSLGSYSSSSGYSDAELNFVSVHGDLA